MHANLIRVAVCLPQDVKMSMPGFQLSTKSDLCVWLGLTCPLLAQKLHKHLMYSGTWVYWILIKTYND